MIKLLNSVTIAASGSTTTREIDTKTFEQTGVRGYFSYAAVITGSGTGKIEYLVPTTQEDNTQEGYGGFIEPASASDVATGLTAGSYAGSFAPIPSDALKLKVTETGGANSITVDLYIVVK